MREERTFGLSWPSLSDLGNWNFLGLREKLQHGKLISSLIFKNWVKNVNLWPLQTLKIISEGCTNLTKYLICHLLWFGLSWIHRYMKFYIWKPNGKEIHNLIQFFTLRIRTAWLLNSNNTEITICFSTFRILHWLDFLIQARLPKGKIYHFWNWIRNLANKNWA